MLATSLTLIAALFGPITVGTGLTHSFCGQDAYEGGYGAAPFQIRSGERVSARVCAKDSDSYGLHLSQGETVEISISSLRARDISTVVFGPNDSAIAVDRIEQPGGFLLRFRVSTAGVYQIRLEGRKPEGIAYGLMAQSRVIPSRPAAPTVNPPLAGPVFVFD